MITFDTSGLLALLNKRDPDHGACTVVLGNDRGPYVVPALIMAEVAYFVEHRLAPKALLDLLVDLERGALILDGGLDDVARVRALVKRYADLPLGFSDAAVIACAERRGGRVLSLDRRHVGVVAREGTIRVLPEPEGT